MLFCISHHPAVTRVAATCSPRDALLPENQSPFIRLQSGCKAVLEASKIPKHEEVKDYTTKAEQKLPGASWCNFHPWLSDSPQGRHFPKTRLHPCYPPMPDPSSYRGYIFDPAVLTSKTSHFYDSSSLISQPAR